MDKRTLLHLYFEYGLTYSKETGFKNAELPAVVKIAKEKSGSNKDFLVEMAGVKPASKECSVQNWSQA